MRILVASCALALAALTACSAGTSNVPQSDLEDQVGALLTGDGAEDADVSCEGALDAEVDAEQTCSITSAEGDSTGLRITVTKVNDDDVDYDTELFLTADEVASGTEAGLVDQGYEVSSVTCDDELVGEVGNSVVCTVTDSEGEYDIESTVSAIDGLRFSLEFADVA